MLKLMKLGKNEFVLFCQHALVHGTLMFMRRYLRKIGLAAYEVQALLSAVAV